MTEAEWLISDHPDPLVTLLGIPGCPGRDRKLRLLACAFCRLHDDCMTAEQWRTAIEVAENYADQAADYGAMLAAGAVAHRATHVLFRASIRDCLLAAFQSLQPLLPQEPEAGEVGLVVRLRAMEQMRDIFGNPFRPVTFAPEWRTDTAVALARQMYEARDFSAMPILADALQDAGCDSEEVLAHCRGPGPHVRGCWVVDLVLENE